MDEFQSAPIVIDKSITVCGDPRGQSILNRADYGVAILIRANNVSLVLLRVSQGSPASEERLLSRELEATIVVGDLTRIEGFTMEDVEVNFIRVGVALKANDFSLSRVFLVQNQDSIMGTGIVIDGNRGNSRVDYLHYEAGGSVESVMVNLIGSEENSGTLTISNSTHFGHVGVFFRQNKFIGSPGAFTLLFVDNEIGDADFFVLLSLARSADGSGDVFNRIEAVGNRYEDHQGSGLITVDAYGVFRSTALPLLARGNRLPLTGLNSHLFSEATGSVGSLCRYLLGSRFTVDLVE